MPHLQMHGGRGPWTSRWRAGSRLLSVQLAAHVTNPPLIHCRLAQRPSTRIGQIGGGLARESLTSWRDTPLQGTGMGLGRGQGYSGGAGECRELTVPPFLTPQLTLPTHPLPAYLPPCPPMPRLQMHADKEGWCVRTMDGAAASWRDTPAGHGAWRQGATRGGKGGGVQRVDGPTLPHLTPPTHPSPPSRWQARVEGRQPPVLRRHMSRPNSNSNLAACGLLTSHPREGRPT